LIFRSKNKNDRNDAQRLAKILHLGETPTVHVSSPEVRTWRELVIGKPEVVLPRFGLGYVNPAARKSRQPLPVWKKVAGPLGTPLALLIVG
jgi:hypothetical protein